MKHYTKFLFILMIFPFLSESIKAQSALDLTGTGNYSQTNYNLNQTAFTVEYDMFIHAHQNFNAGVTFTTGNNPSPLDFYVNNTGQISSVVGNSAAFHSLSLGPITAGAWHNIAYVYPGGGAGIKVFIDGVQVGTHMGFGYNPFFSNGFFRIGDRMDGVTNSNAKYDNIHIWSIARSNSEVNIDRTRCFTGNEAGLDILYDMEGAVGTTVQDLALGDGAQNGTITGSFSYTTGVLPLALVSGGVAVVSQCEEYTDPLGVTHYESGVYMDTISSVGGCDSIVNYLKYYIPTINESSYLVNDTIVCEGESTAIVFDNTISTDVMYSLYDVTNSVFVDGPYLGATNLNLSTGPVNGTTTYQIVAEKNRFHALEFNGIDQEVVLGETTYPAGYSPTLNHYYNGQHDVTIEAWVYTNSTNSLQTIVGNYVGSNMTFLLRLDDLYPAFWVDNGIFTSVVGATQLSQNTWYHIAGTWDGTDLKIYVNGVLDGSEPCTGNFVTNTDPFKIGGGLSNGTEYFSGKIHGVRFWNTAKPESEIASQMNECLNTILVGNILAYYDMIEEAGDSTLANYLGHGYNGTLVNMDPNTAWGVADIPNFTCSYCDITFQDDIIIETGTLTAGNTLSGITLTATPSGEAYQWINCATNAPVAGATNETFTPTANGNYAVVVDNGLCTDTSSCVAVNGVGIEENNLIAADIYPNPSSNQVTISFDGAVANLKITDAQGKLIRQQSIQNNATLSISSFDNGIYFFEIATEKGSTIKRVSKQ
jgi:Concanavalin A-like lectin/glucanases superfamily/Secretion system C-terminal sorting domain